ncbi:YdcF family protein [Nocardia sp. NPDC050712]|uniref:YdcF family protein n=1 Tax=Nocardia sp. NPDC050712 TaxID=3155518 RepID=UPI0033D2A181
MILLLIGVLLLGVFALRFRGDRRRLGNGVFLLLGLVFVWVGLAADDSETALGLLAGVLIVLSPLLVLVLAGLLIVNGVQVVRREGPRVANLLSFGLGVALLLPYALLIVAVATGSEWFAFAVISVLVAVSYLSFLLVAFLLYSFVYGRAAYHPGMSAIVVHGSGLAGDRVPPLLAGRLDKALDVYRAEVAAGRHPLLVTSGGKGSDEAVSEAAAMARYLTERGVPADALLLEDRSTTTRENLEYTRDLLAARGLAGPMVLVTSNFHILRTAILARRLGLDAEAVGSRTAFYYLPSAALREFVGVLVEHRWTHGLACLACLALPAVVLLLVRLMPA